MLNRRLGGLAMIVWLGALPTAWADEADADSAPASVEGAAAATASGSGALSAAAANSSAAAGSSVAFTPPAQIESRTRACLADAARADDKAAKRTLRNQCLGAKRKLTAEFKRSLREIKTQLGAWNKQLISGLAACRRANDAQGVANLEKWRLALGAWVNQIQRFGAAGGERPAASPGPFPETCAAK